MFDEPFHGSRGPASAPILEGHAESFISPAALCARRAGRSAADRLLCKQEVLGSNPSRSTPVPYLPRFKSAFTTVPDFGFGNVCLALREPLNRAPVRHAVGSAGTRASTT